MQTPKARTSSLEVPQKKSPATPRTARQLKTLGSDSDPVSSSLYPASRTPKDKSPKVIERRSPQSPNSEKKKRPSRVSELESQLAQLQEDLKKAKDQLNSSESWKRRAQQEAEEAKQELFDMSAKLEESQQQLLEISASEEARLQELRKISQDRDRAWQSELEAVQRQHSMDSAALASAMNEIQKLKVQLEVMAESEATQIKSAESAHAEVKGLRMELSRTLDLVERLNTERNNCKESEAWAIEIVNKTQRELEEANATAEMLRSDGIKAMEAYNSLSVELEQSKVQVESLGGRMSTLHIDVVDSNGKKLVDPAGTYNIVQENEENEETKQLKMELNSLKLEVGKLKAALDAAEVRYQEEYIQSTLQIRSAYEQVEHTKSESCQREAEMELELEKLKAQIEELRFCLMGKETELHSISEENGELKLKIEKNMSSEKEYKLAMALRKSEADLAELKASLSDKEAELQNSTEENELLKMEIKKSNLERKQVHNEVVALAEEARTAEREALMKLGNITEEADKSSQRAERATEQLDAAQAANSEMEAELRRLKVQSDQWRKAAEAAAAMLTTANNGKFVERTTSHDSSNNPMGSPYSEEDDDSPKKKNGNMLKKIGVLWKKGQK